MESIDNSASWQTSVGIYQHMTNQFEISSTQICENIFQISKNYANTRLSNFHTYNPGQNSLGQMFFALKEAFPVCKLLPFTANAPSPPPLQCWLLKEDILVNSSMKFLSAFNIAMGGGGISTRNFLQNTKCITRGVYLGEKRRGCARLNKIL